MEGVAREEQFRGQRGSPAMFDEIEVEAFIGAVNFIADQRQPQPSGMGADLVLLGTLARIYQVKRDGDGEYRVFARLASLRPGDRDFANNLTYFAVMTGQADNVTVEKIARDNFEAKPDNIYYRSTWALVLCRLAKANEALRVLEPVSSDWTTSSAIAWAYGAALAGLGRTDEAKRIFDTINPDKLSFQEISWVHALLK